jgi:hypothetical protein
VFQRTGRFPSEVMDLPELEQEFIFQSTIVAIESEQRAVAAQRR